MNANAPSGGATQQPGACAATDPERTGVLGTGFFRNLGGPGLAPSPDAVLAAIDQGLRA